MPLMFLSALLHRLDPERAHGVVLTLLGLVGRFPVARGALRRWLAPPAKPVVLWGRTFRHPVGLAAGYDKDGVAWRGLAALGFAFVEVGTVTPRPQPGNPRPRIVRVPQAQALVNWMGFPSRGMDFVARQLQGPRPPDLVLGVNLGRNKDTPNERAGEDYVAVARRLAPLADYLVVNVSSPNTPELRALQRREHLAPLLQAVRQAVKETVPDRPPPVLVKVAPDLTWAELNQVLEAVEEAGVQGIIATNTTVAKSSLPPAYRDLPGGVSGAPLRERSTQVVRYIYRHTGGRLPIIGVGGILSARDALEKAEAGARLVQVFTGWVYRGPTLLQEVVRAW